MDSNKNDGLMGCGFKYNEFSFHNTMILYSAVFMA